MAHINAVSKPRKHIAKVVKQTLRNQLEHKCCTLGSPIGGNWTTGGTVTPLSYIVGQGDNIYQRSGDQITILRLRMEWHMASTGAGNSTAARIIILSDSMANGTTPSILDVLDSADFRSHYNLVNEQHKRFKILHDSNYVLVTGTHHEQRTPVMDFKFKGHKCFFNDNTATPANLSRGSLHMLVISNSTGNGGFSTNYAINYLDA